MDAGERARAALAEVRDIARHADPRCDLPLHEALLAEVARPVADAIREAVAAERERCALIAGRTATGCEARATGDPLRSQYSRTIAEGDRAAAAELRDVALLIREGQP